MVIPMVTEPETEESSDSADESDDESAVLEAELAEMEMDEVFAELVLDDPAAGPVPDGAD
jgi:hypothetical protein